MDFATIFVLIYGVILGTAIFVLVYYLLFLDGDTREVKKPRPGATAPKVSNTPPKLKPRKM